MPRIVLELLWWSCGLRRWGAVVRWSRIRRVCRCRGILGGGPEGCVLAVFGVVVVLGHPLLENINWFGGQVAIVRDVNEVFHQHLQPARVVTGLAELLLQDNELLPGFLPLGRKSFITG